MKHSSESSFRRLRSWRRARRSRFILSSDVRRIKSKDLLQLGHLRMIGRRSHPMSPGTYISRSKQESTSELATLRRILPTNLFYIANFGRFEAHLKAFPHTPYDTAKHAHSHVIWLPRPRKGPDQIEFLV